MNFGNTKALLVYPLGQLKLHHQHGKYGCHLVSRRGIASTVNMARCHMHGQLKLNQTIQDVWMPFSHLKWLTGTVVWVFEITSTECMDGTWLTEVTSPVQLVCVALGQLK